MDLDRLGMSDKPVLDFSVNLNPFGIPPIIKEKWAELFETIEQYPGVEGDGIARYYQAQFVISSDNILAGNGSTKMIYLVPRVLGFRHVLVITPSYHDYERASFTAGAKVEQFPLLPDNKFSSVEMDELVAALGYADVKTWLARK